MMLGALIDAGDVILEQWTVVDLRPLSKGAHPSPGGHGWQAIPNTRAGGYRRKHGVKWEYWYPSAHHAMAEHHFSSKLKETGRWEHKDETATADAAAAYLQEHHGVGKEDLEAGRKDTKVTVAIGKKGHSEITSVAYKGQGRAFTEHGATHMGDVSGKSQDEVDDLAERHRAGKEKGRLGGDAKPDADAPAKAQAKPEPPAEKPKPAKADPPAKDPKDGRSAEEERDREVIRARLKAIRAKEGAVDKPPPTKEPEDGREKKATAESEVPDLPKDWKPARKKDPSGEPGAEESRSPATGDVRKLKRGESAPTDEEKKRLDERMGERPKKSAKSEPEPVAAKDPETSEVPARKPGNTDKYIRKVHGAVPRLHDDGMSADFDKYQKTAMAMFKEHGIESKAGPSGIVYTKAEGDGGKWTVHLPVGALAERFPGLGLVDKDGYVSDTVMKPTLIAADGLDVGLSGLHNYIQPGSIATSTSTGQKPMAKGTLATLAESFRSVTGAGVLWLPESYGESAYALCKGAGHKYIKRVPTGKVTKTGKPRYRYFYHAAHGHTVAHQDHFVVGASFRDGPGHQHITARDGDTITLKHDETGAETKMTVAELHAHLAGVHADGIATGRASALADLATAHANGASPKQLKRLEERATRTGARLPGGTHGSSENGGTGVRRPDAGAEGGDRPDDGGASEKPKRTRKVTAKAVSEYLGPTEATASDYLADPVAAKEWVPVPSPALTMHEDLAPVPTVKLPEHLKVFPKPNVKKGITQLFPHQIDGAERALTAFEKTDGIVISDDAGLGKTNTGMATLLGHGGKRNLIVVPTNGKHGIMRQWRETAALYGAQNHDGPPTSDDQEGIFLVSYDELVEKKQTDAEIASRIEWFKLQIADTAAEYNRRLEEGLAADFDPYNWASRDANRRRIDAMHAEKDKAVAEIVAEAAAEGLADHLHYARFGGKKKPGAPARGLHPSLKGGFDLAIFDEAHSMAGSDGQRAKAAMDLQTGVGKAVYLSATPFTGVKDMHYLTKLGMFSDREEFLKWAKKAGATVKGNVVENPSSALPMAAIAATMHVDGTMLKRTANMKGQTSAFRVLDNTASAHPAKNPDAAATFDGADQVFKTAAAAGVLKQSFIKAFRSSWSRQYWETLKVDEAIEQGKKALAEGKQVAFFTSYKGADHAHLRALVGIAERKADRIEASNDPMGAFKAAALRETAASMQRMIDALPKVEPAIKRLVEAFGGPKVVAEIHGDTNKKPEEEQALYQSGARKVVVATMARGGTGISLHDDQGLAPRVQVNLSLPWSGREFNQVAGRSHRLGSRSNTTMHWLVGDDDTEEKNATVVAKRLKSMGSLTVGDPEATIEARQLANFDFGEALDTDLSAKEIADAALAAEDDDDDATTDEAQAARDYFREYAEARKSGRNVISEQYERRKLEREKKVHAQARKAIVQLATRWPMFSEASRYKPRTEDDLGNYAVSSSVKRAMEKAGVAVKGRISQDGTRWYIDPSELPRMAQSAGVHRVEADRDAVKVLAERHARYLPEASDLKDHIKAPEPYRPATVTPTSTGSTDVAAALRGVGLKTRHSMDGRDVYVSGNTRQHVQAFRDVGARWQPTTEEWKVPATALSGLAHRTGGMAHVAPPPPPVVTVTPSHEGPPIPEHVREFVDDYEGDVRAHAAKKLAGELSPASRQHWQDVDRYAKSKLGKGGIFGALVEAFAP